MAETTADHPWGDDLLVEDVLLLLFDPRAGMIHGEGTLFYVLGGAVVAQLALEDAVDLDHSRLGARTMRAQGEQAPQDPLLAEAWEQARSSPRKLQTVIAGQGPTLRAPVLDRLVERGHLVRSSRKILGLLPSTRLELGSTGRRESLVDQIRPVLEEGQEAEARTMALAALVAASGQLPALHGDVPWNGAVASRAEALKQGEWAAAATSIAVQRTTQAILASAVLAGSIHSAGTS